MSNPGVRLGIVVSVRNCLKLTQEMLASIRTRHSYSVYIVDDRSDAATKEWLRGQPSIRTFTDPPLSTGVAYNWNLGIAAALQDGCTHFLVVNNDILFHPATIDLMVERIDRGDVALVTAHDVGGTYRDPAQVMELTARIEGEDERPEFFCFSLTEQALKQIGWFDESFAGAYYEDNDYHARIALANLKAVRLLGAPVFHYGTATIRSDRGASAEIGQAAHRNKEYFLHKWGRLPAGDPREMRHAYFPTPFNRPLIYQDAPRQRIQELFECALARQSDISDHIDYLYRLGSSVHRITEFSPGGGQSTCAFLKSWPRSLHVYESDVSPHLELIAIAARLAGIDFLQHREESDTAQIEETDLLFIDTWHIEERMREDLRRHADKVERFIILHDTATFAHSGETAGHRGIWPPISDFLRGHPEWRILQHFPYNNGLTVLARRGGMTSRGESA